jgi:hypothetical protein
MNDRSVDVLKVYRAGGINIVHVPNGRGEELRIHLASHNIDAKVSPPAETPYERLEVPGDVDAEMLQAILDHWER